MESTKVVLVFGLFLIVAIKMIEGTEVETTLPECCPKYDCSQYVNCECCSSTGFCKCYDQCGYQITTCMQSVNPCGCSGDTETCVCYSICNSTANCTFTRSGSDYIGYCMNDETIYTCHIDEGQCPDGDCTTYTCCGTPRYPVPCGCCKNPDLTGSCYPTACFCNGVQTYTCLFNTTTGTTVCNGEALPICGGYNIASQCYSADGCFPWDCLTEDAYAVNGYAQCTSENADFMSNCIFEQMCDGSYVWNCCRTTSIPENFCYSNEIDQELGEACNCAPF